MPVRKKRKTPAKKKIKRKVKNKITSKRKSIATPFGKIEVSCGDRNSGARKSPKKTKKRVSIPKTKKRVSKSASSHHRKVKRKKVSLNRPPKEPGKNAPLSSWKKYVKAKKNYLEHQRKLSREKDALKRKKDSLKKQARSIGRGSRGSSYIPKIFKGILY